MSFDDNFYTLQAPDPNIKHADTMDRVFKIISLEMNTHIYFIMGD
jgi:hypothetical protein